MRDFILVHDFYYAIFYCYPYIYIYIFAITNLDNKQSVFSLCLTVAIDKKFVYTALSTLFSKLNLFLKLNFNTHLIEFICIVLYFLW